MSTLTSGFSLTQSDLRERIKGSGFNQIVFNYAAHLECWIDVLFKINRKIKKNYVCKRIHDRCTDIFILNIGVGTLATPPLFFVVAKLYIPVTLTKDIFSFFACQGF